MIEIIMTREIIRIDIDQIVKIEGHHIKVEVSIDKVIKEDCIILIHIEMIIEEITLEICKIIESNFRGGYRRNKRNNNFGRDRNRSRDRQYSDNIRRKDTFHSLRLLKNSKRYCGILPYFCSTLYLYQRMPIGLNISPSI